MTPEFPPNNPRAELEARLTAFILGELPAHDAAALRQTIDDDPQLAALYDRLSAAHKLVREATASPAEPASESPAPLRLSEARRQKLLAQFKTVKPKEFAPQKKPMISRRLLQVAAIVALVGLIAGVLLWNSSITPHEGEAFQFSENSSRLAVASPREPAIAEQSASARMAADAISPEVAQQGVREMERKAAKDAAEKSTPPAKTTIVLPHMDNSGNGDTTLTWNTHDSSTQPPVVLGNIPSKVAVANNNWHSNQGVTAADNNWGYFSRFRGENNVESSATNHFSPDSESLGIADNSGQQVSGNNSYVQSGDPDWIGFLEHPDQRHSASNSFLSRGAFVAIPQNDSLDANSIHNQANPQPASKPPVSVSASSRGFYDDTYSTDAKARESAPNGSVAAGDIVATTGLPYTPSQSASEPKLETRTYHLDAKKLHHAMEDTGIVMADASKPAETLSSPPDAGGMRFVTGNTNSTDALQGNIEKLYAAAGVDLNGKDGKTFVYNERKGTLTVRGEPKDLAQIDEVNKALSAPAPRVKLKATFAEISQPDDRALGFNWTLGNFTNGANLVGSGGTQPGFNGAPGTANPAGQFPGAQTYANATTTYDDATKYRQVTQVDNSAALKPADKSADFAQPNYIMTNGVMEVLTSPEVTTESGRTAKIESSEIATIVSPRAAESRGSSMRQDASLAPDDGQNFTYKVVDGKLVAVPAPNNVFQFSTSSNPYVTGTYFGGINGQAASQYAYVPADKVPHPEVATEGGRVSKAESPRAAESSQYFSGIGAINNGVVQNPQLFVETTPSSSYAAVQDGVIVRQPAGIGAAPQGEFSGAAALDRAEQFAHLPQVPDSGVAAKEGSTVAQLLQSVPTREVLIGAKLAEQKELADATRLDELSPGTQPSVNDGWTTKTHNNAGNIGAADGSVQQVTVNGFRSFANHTGDLNTNANVLLFPGDEQPTASPQIAGKTPASGQRTSGFNDRLKSLGLKTAGIGSSGQVASSDTTFNDSVQPPVVAALPKTPTDKVPLLGDMPAFGRLFRSEGNTNPIAEPVVHAGEIDFPDVSVNELLDVYGKLTGRNIVASPNLPQARINLASTSDLTESQAKQAIESVLAMNGVSVVNVGSNVVKAVPVAVVGTLASAFSTNDTSLGNVTVTVDPETKRVFYITDPETAASVSNIMRHLDTNSGTPLLVSTNYVTNGGRFAIQYANASEINNDTFKKLLYDNQKNDGHSEAYREKKAELDRLKKFQEIMALRVAQDSTELKMPTTEMVSIVEHADGKASQSPGLGQRIGRMFTGKETQTARIKIERDVTDIPGGSGQSNISGVYDPYFVQTEFEVIQSGKVLDQVIDKLKLDQAWAAQKGSTVPLSRSETRALLKKNLEVALANNTGLVDIKVKSDKPEEAAKIANSIAEAYDDYRKQQREDLIEGGMKAAKTELAEQQKKIAQVEQELAELGKGEKADADVAVAKHSTNAPIPQPEVSTADNAFSTFSLNISDVSLKLAAASLEKGRMPDASSIRSEEFINAFDYRDPEPAPGAPLGFAWERAQYPFAHNRDLLRFAVKTAATGREPGRPLNIVLLLDKSGSMERADRVRIIHEALRVLATQLQPQDKISVVTFARVARLWVDGLSGSQAAEVADGLDQLTPEGGTNLEEAMRLAYETARRHYLANGINRVVLLTDGAANLGNVDPDALKVKVEEHRKEGIALDCFGVGWEGYNDDLLEVLSRNGGGRYGFINTPEEAATDFVGQLAGALNVAAYDVKVQVEFNPKRVTNWRQIGYAKHQLTKEQFRDNTVKAAQIAAAESGNGLYAIEINPSGEGPVATVRVRYRVPDAEDYPEHEYQVPYTGGVLPLEQSSPAMRLMGSASAFSEWLASSPFAGEVTTDKLLSLMSGVPETYGADQRPKKLEWMIRQAKSLQGK